MNQRFEDIQFRLSPTWIKYSHERYLPLDDIRHRVGMDAGSAEWARLSAEIAAMRFSQALIFFIESINKGFWYFEADCIKHKLSDVERLGTEVYDKIHAHKTFEKEFILNSEIEEAVTSAIYEGANTTRARAKQFIAEKREPRDKVEQMLINNFQARQWVRNNVTRQIDIHTILEIHSMVTHNTLEEHSINYAGKLRDDVVYVGNHEGIDYKLIQQAILQAIEVCLNNPRFIHPLIRGILLHYFIAYIHPFFDGNGRTARTLFYFNGIKNGLKYLELLSISADLKSHGKRYEKAFEYAVKYDGDVTYFVDFSLDSLLVALRQVERKIVFLQGVWRLKDLFDLSDNQIILLQRLALHKFRKITIEELAEDTKKSHEMARLELKDLTAKGFLTEGKSGRNLTYQINAQKLKELVAGNLEG